MPMIQFNPPTTDWDALTLVAVRVWPEDEAKRQDFLRACFPLWIEDRRTHFPEAYATAEFWKVVTHISEALGGWRTIAEAPRYSELKKSVHEASLPGLLVGLALTLAHQLIEQGHPPKLVSVNRLAYFFEEFSPHLFKGITVSRASFIRAWMKFKPVAHIWAAHLAATGFWNWGAPGEVPSDQADQTLRSEQETLQTLLHAQAFYRFGTTFEPFRGRGPLLDPNTTWEIQADLEGAPFRLANIPDIYLKGLSSYPRTR